MGAFDYDEQADKYIRQDRQIKVPETSNVSACLCGRELKIPSGEGKQDFQCPGCGETWQVYNSPKVFDGRPRSKKKEKEG